MASKVVSTKLSIEEHGKFLQICKQDDSTPSALIKKLILNHISSKNSPKQIADSKTMESTQVKTEPQLQKPEPQLEIQKLQLQKPEPQLEIPKTEAINELAKTAEDKIAFEIIKRVEEDDITYETLHEIYNKLNEKYEHGGLTKIEEILFRKVHRHLREKVREQPEVQRMSLDERFQYF